MLKYVLLFLFSLTSVNAQNKQNYNIGFILDIKTEYTQSLLLQLQEQVIAVVGEDANIQFSNDNVLVNNYNLEKAKLNYQQLLSNETDIIIAFGVVSNEALGHQKTFKKPTILFGANNQDITTLDLNKKTSGIENFTYLIESKSYKQDISKLKQLVDFKNIGIVIDESIVDFLPLKSTFDKISNELKIDYRIIPFSEVSDITKQLDKVDAIYIAGGFFLKENEVKTLSQSLIDNKIPSFTINGIKQVENGIMASHQAQGDIGQFFRRIALTIENYINGVSLADQPVYIDYTSQLTINYNTADVLGVPIKYSLIADTDFVGDFKNAKSKESFNLIEAINQALTNNLSLQTYQKDTELSYQNIRSAKSNYLPDISISTTKSYIDPNLAEISGGSNPENSTSGAFIFKQTIYSNAANANIEIQRNLLNAQIENFNADKLDMVFNVANAYFNTLILKSKAEIQLQNLKLTKNNLKLATQSYDSGKSSKADMLRFLSEKAQNTQVMVETANQLEQSYIKLNQLLNYPVNFELNIEDAKLDSGVFKNYNYNQLIEVLDDPRFRDKFVLYLTQKALINAPELKILDYNIAATNTDIRLNGASRFIPTISLQGQYNNTFSRSGIGSIPPSGSNLLDDNYNIGLTFSVPLFNKNQFNINRQKAIIQKQQLELSKQNTNQLIATNIRIGVLNLVNQMTNMKLSKVSQETALKSMELIRNSYETGAVTIADLLDAQNNYTNARLTNTNSIYNFLISAIQLERYVGYYFLLNTEEKNRVFKNQFITFMQKSQDN